MTRVGQTPDGSYPPTSWERPLSSREGPGPRGREGPVGAGPLCSARPGSVSVSFSFSPASFSVFVSCFFVFVFFFPPLSLPHPHPVSGRLLPPES